MAKKKRKAKRSTKAGRRSRATSAKKAAPARTVKAVGKASGVGNVSGVGAASVAATGNAAGAGAATGVGAFGPGFQGTGFQTEAVRSTLGEVKPPHVPRAAPIPITPTVYPDTSQGQVIIQNHITINIYSAEFVRFSNSFEALIDELRQSNEISGEVRDQLLSELRAGKEIITTAPKPQRDLIELLLVRPLKWLAEKSGSAMVSKLATDALEWLSKML